MKRHEFIHGVLTYSHACALSRARAAAAERVANARVDALLAGLDAQRTAEVIAIAGAVEVA